MKPRHAKILINAGAGGQFDEKLRERLNVERLGWNPASVGFTSVSEERFLHSAESWMRVD